MRRMAVGLILVLVAVSAAWGETVLYSYDNAGRLLKADYGNDKYISYAYDNNGNILTRGVNQSASTNYTLTVAVNPNGGGRVTGGGIDCPGTCTQEYPNGSGVSLTATPATGFAFDHWTGDCAGCGNPCAITMDSDKTCAAVFGQGGGGGGEGGQGTTCDLRPPAYLSAEAGCGFVTLRWGEVPNARGYLIYNADTNSLLAWVKKGSVTTYTLYNLPEGKRFSFYVRAQLQCGNSRPTSPVSVETLSCQIPSLELVWPQNGAAINYNDFGSGWEYAVVFAWNRISNAKGYAFSLELKDAQGHQYKGQVVLSSKNGLIEAGNLAGIYFILDKAGWNSLVPYTVTWQVSALADPEDPRSVIATSEKYSFTFNEAP